MGAAGFETIMGLDALAGEPVATYFVGGWRVVHMVLLLEVQLGQDWLTGKYKKKCP